LIIEGVVTNSRRVKERLKTGGIVRIAGDLVQERLRTDGRVVDTSDPTMTRGKFKIALACTGAPDKIIIMKYSLALMWIFALFGAIPGRADDVLPPRFHFDRYSAMVKNSPFAIATAVAVPAAPPDFAKDLYVANAARSPEGYMVTIASSSDANFKKYLNTQEPMDGYSIASIEWSEKVGETKVTISKDGKFATLTFNQALLSQAAPPGPPAPSQVNQSVPLIPPPGVGQASRAHSRGVIQRNPKAVAAAASAPNPVPAPTPDLAPPAPGVTSLPNLNVAPSAPDASKPMVPASQHP